MRIFIGVTAALIVAVLAAAYVAFSKTFLSVRKKHSDLYHGTGGDMTEMKMRRREMLKRMAELPYEDVNITSYDGKRLHARYYHVADGAPIAIQLHGYKSMGIRDFCGGAQECMQLGQNVLLVDQRAHGESDGKVISFGIKERYDCKSWAEYAISRFGADSQVILYGISMGAATVLMASELDLPKNVVGIVADCPYSDIGAIIKRVCRRMKLPARLLYPLIKLSAVIYGGFNPDSASPKRAVANTKLPILLIHGEGDNFVPCYMSDEIAAAGKTVTYLKIPEATHGTSMLYDRERYMQAVTEFLEKTLKR